MENGIKVFERQEFGQVRVVDVNGEPWFVARDVCECLELTNTSQTLSYLDDDEKGITTNDTPGGMQDIPGEWKGRNWIMTPGGEQEMLSEDNALC